MENVISMRDIIINTRKIKLHENFLEDGNLRDLFYTGLEIVRCSYNDYVKIKSWLFILSEKLFFNDYEELAYIACDALKVLLCNRRNLNTILLKLIKKKLEPYILKIMGICCLTVASRMQQINSSTRFNEILDISELNHLINEYTIRQIEIDVFVSLAHSGFCFEKTITPVNDINNIMCYLEQYEHFFNENFNEFKLACNLMLQIIYCTVPVFNMNIYNYSIVNLMIRLFIEDNDEYMFLHEKFKENYFDKEILDMKNFKVHVINIINAFKSESMLYAKKVLLYKPTANKLFQLIEKKIEQEY